MHVLDRHGATRSRWSGFQMWRTWSANVEVIVAANIMAESANQNGSRASVARPGRCKSAPPHASLPMMTGRQRTPFNEEGPNLTKAGKPWAGLGNPVRTRRTGQGNGTNHEWVRAVLGGHGPAENAWGEGVCVCAKLQDRRSTAMPRQMYGDGG